MLALSPFRLCYFCKGCAEELIPASYNPCPTEPVADRPCSYFVCSLLRSLPQKPHLLAIPQFRPELFCMFYILYIFILESVIGCAVLDRSGNK
jgi:hypothetical protein